MGQWRAQNQFRQNHPASFFFFPSHNLAHRRSSSNSHSTNAVLISHAVSWYSAISLKSVKNLKAWCGNQSKSWSWQLQNISRLRVLRLICLWGKVTWHWDSSSEAVTLDLCHQMWQFFMDVSDGKNTILAAEVNGCERPVWNGYQAVQLSKKIKIDADASVTAWEQYVNTCGQMIKVPYVKVLHIDEPAFFVVSAAGFFIKQSWLCGSLHCACAWYWIRNRAMLSVHCNTLSDWFLCMSALSFSLSKMTQIHSTGW